ncbi:hypothetical protein CLA18_06230 [Pseudomonas protegens]|nr:hypothetical protein CLA18_06230 [Pseudomonas protegens]
MTPAKTRLVGAGFSLYEAEGYKNAKSCVAIAAPNYTRAFCYLSTSTDQETWCGGPVRHRLARRKATVENLCRS